MTKFAPLAHWCKLELDHKIAKVTVFGQQSFLTGCKGMLLFKEKSNFEWFLQRF